MTAAVLEKPIIDHIVASEKYRLDTFSDLLALSSATRRQLALAGFIYRNDACICPQCGVNINLESIEDSIQYAPNYFRVLHRKKVSYLGSRCAFLLCESGTNIDDLRPSPVYSESSKKIEWEDAEKPTYSDYSTRLQTFSSWPHVQQASNSFVTPEIMAEYGFYFSGPDDGVTCFYCGNTITCWSNAIQDTNEKVVQLEHARFFPCHFITLLTSLKFVSNAGYLHVVSEQERRSRNPITCESSAISNKPESIDECLSTFANWPSTAPVAPEDLAKVGFYYTGDELRVRCFRCDLEVDDWTYVMTAYGTHQRRNRNCEIILAIQSTRSGDFQCANEKWRLQTLQGLSFHTNDDERLWRELAACGFYRFKNTSDIRCAFCGVIIELNASSTIMSQHRALAKRLQRSSLTDCIMVRAQCPANVTIPDRELFPEYTAFKSVFDRVDTFAKYKERYKVSDEFIRMRADAGFFRETMRLMRCFHCGNALPIDNKKIYDKYRQNDIAKLHAHIYPTCEWVHEILGAKYIGQVLWDRNKLNETEYQQSYRTQFSTMPSTPRESFSSLPSTPITTETVHTLEAAISDYEVDSDDEGYEPVASPVKSTYLDTNFFAHSTSTVSLGTSSDSSSLTSVAQICGDATNHENNNPSKSSPIIENAMNPFQLNSLAPRSPPVDLIRSETSPIDPQAYYAFESNRLESFKKHKRQTFADLTVEELAYAGFHLDAQGIYVRCLACNVELTEEKFVYILQSRPVLPDSPLNDEPWTAMRVHRHEMGQHTDQNHAYCLWVKRERGGLYPNVVMPESMMRYPEYPSYSTIEKRTQSFDCDWIYPSGSRLSSVVMAHAGYIYLGAGKVCCYYCGNRMCDFEPRDCPFEEHAMFNPLCDYLIHKRGIAFIDRILKECPPPSPAKQKCELNGGQKIKSIIWPKSGPTVNKSSRAPVKRLYSRISTASNRFFSRSMTNSSEIIEDACHVCFENKAIYEYKPCRHSPMCGECFAKLNQQQCEECFICRRTATVSQRVPSNSNHR